MLSWHYAKTSHLNFAEMKFKKEITCFFSFLFILFQLLTHAQINDPYYRQGVYNFSIGKYNGAIEDFNKCIKVNEDFAEAFFYRGNAYFNMGKHTKAIKDLEKSIKLKPEFADAHNSLGHVYNELNESKKAIKHLNLAITIDPVYADAFNNRGVSNHRLGKFRAAIEDFSKALELDSTFALAYNNRGSARYYNQNVATPHHSDVELAIADFTSALKYNPDLLLAVRNKAIALSMIGHYPEAIENHNRSIQLAHKDPANYMARARTLNEMKEYDAAIRDYNNALRNDPFIEDAYVEMGNCKSRLNRHGESIQDQLRAAEINPKAYSGLAFYNVACNYSLIDEKDMMFKYLNLCRKENYFKNKIRFEHFLQDKDFKNFRHNQEFVEFVFEIRKKVKIQKTSVNSTQPGS